MEGTSRRSERRGGQIEEGTNGFLVRDPMNLQAFAETVHSVLVDPALAARIGTAARERGYGRNFSGFGTSFSMGLSLRSCWAPCKYRPKAAISRAYKPQEHITTGPNQAWCWDIMYLRNSVRGAHFYLYMVMDIYNRTPLPLFRD